MRLLVCAIFLCASATARADEPLTSFGVIGVVGGGVTAAGGDTGPMWDARAVVGSRLPLAFEVAFLGTGVPSHGGSLDTRMLDATVRLALRPRAAVTPYLFGGIGWAQRELVGAMTPAMPIDTSAASYPLGVGVQVRGKSGVVVDVRGARHAGALETWEAGASVGIEL